MDVSTLNSQRLRDFNRYLEDTELEWIDYFPPHQLSFQEWSEREDPCDPDTDA